MGWDDDDEDLFADDPAPEAAEKEEVDEPERRRRRLERILPKILQKALERGLESGIETISNSGDVLRGVMGENVKLPKEIVGYVFSQVDETKNAMVRVVAHEIRDFLSATDLSQELQKALTSLSFEIRTEIRFIPNDKGGLDPVVKAKVEPKKDGKRAEGEAKSRRRSERPPADEDE